MGFFDFLFGKGNSSHDKGVNKIEQKKSNTPSNLGVGTNVAHKTITPTSDTAKKDKKDTIASYSIEEIYGKGFRFAIDRYEEWENKQCVDQGLLDGELMAEIIGDKIVFTLSGTEHLDIVATKSMELSNPMSQILRSSDRIQYYANCVNGENEPAICHIFYENGRISYVRFAFIDQNSSTWFPLPKRIYEFYGNMIELFDSSAKARSSTDGFSPFVFKSTCHQRYENIMPVEGLQQCLRTVSVVKNTDGCSGYRIKPGDGYIVKIFNNDLGRPNMSDKPMRIKNVSEDLVVLQGYPLQAMSPFGWMEVNYEDYGLEVHYRNGEIHKCVLHMYDRDTYIEYRK